MAKNGTPWKSTFRRPGVCPTARLTITWPSSWVASPVAAPARKDEIRFTADASCCGSAGRNSCAAVREVTASTTTAAISASLAPKERDRAGSAQPLLCCKAVRQRATHTGAPRRRNMLETIAIILNVLWLLGMVSGYTLGNFIYVLLVIAIVLFLVRLISGRRV